MLWAGIGLLCSWFLIVNISSRVYSLEQKVKELQHKEENTNKPKIIIGR